MPFEIKWRFKRRVEQKCILALSETQNLTLFVHSPTLFRIEAVLLAVLYYSAFHLNLK